MTTTVFLGSEHDLATGNALLLVLREMGVEEVSRDWSVVGSQEINTLCFKFRGHSLTVESETYVGLSITGERETVATIRDRVREIVRR